MQKLRSRAGHNQSITKPTTLLFVEQHIFGNRELIDFDCLDDQVSFVFRFR